MRRRVLLEATQDVAAAVTGCHGVVGVRSSNQWPDVDDSAQAGQLEQRLGQLVTGRVDGLALSRGTIGAPTDERCLLILATALAASLTAAAPAPSADRAAGVNAFVVRALVSDGYLAGMTVDSNLVNA